MKLYFLCSLHHLPWRKNRGNAWCHLRRDGNGNSAAVSALWRVCVRCATNQTIAMIWTELRTNLFFVCEQSLSDCSTGAGGKAESDAIAQEQPVGASSCFRRLGRIWCYSSKTASAAGWSGYIYFLHMMGLKNMSVSFSVFHIIFLSHALHDLVRKIRQLLSSFQEKHCSDFG